MTTKINLKWISILHVKFLSVILLHTVEIHDVLVIYNNAMPYDYTNYHNFIPTFQPFLICWHCKYFIISVNKMRIY